MTDKPDDPPQRNGQTLNYQTPAKVRPTPLWKHLLFVPLLFWIALFILGVFLVLVFGLFHMIR